jgi:hypothetical protein
MITRVLSFHGSPLIPPMRLGNASISFASPKVCRVSVGVEKKLIPISTTTTSAVASDLQLVTDPDLQTRDTSRRSIMIAALHCTLRVARDIIYVASCLMALTSNIPVRPGINNLRCTVRQRSVSMIPCQYTEPKNNDLMLTGSN